MATVYSAGDFRNGTTFEMDGNVYKNSRIPTRKTRKRISICSRQK